MLGARSDRAWADTVLQPESGDKGELSAGELHPVCLPDSD